MDIIFILGAFALVLFILIFIIRIPIIIAKRRNLKESDINVIALLSWISLLVGVTWIIALVMSLVYQPPINKQSPSNDLDELSKLFELKEKGILSQEEFERAKSRVL